MSSQDTISSAQREEENANILRGEIDKKQAEIDALQNDISSRHDIIESMRTKEQQHTDDGQRLRQRAMEEQQQEQRDQLQRQQEQNKESVAGQVVRHGLFF